MPQHKRHECTHECDVGCIEAMEPMQYSADCGEEHRECGVSALASDEYFAEPRGCHFAACASWSFVNMNARASA